MKDISIYDFYRLYQTSYSVKLIDVRDPYTYDKHHIPGSVNIPLEMLREKYHLFLNKQKHYFLVCKNGSLSTIAARFLSLKGFNVTNVCGGLDKWEGRFVKTNTPRLEIQLDEEVKIN